MEGNEEQRQHEPEREDVVSKSADDILNELFTELGSKQLTESVADFLGTPKKKKKKKEKEKDKKEKEKKDKLKKIKDKEKISKKKKKDESTPKKKNKLEAEDHKDHEEGERDSEKRKKKDSSKSKERVKDKAVLERDVEEGEIIEKSEKDHKHHHHRHKLKEEEPRHVSVERSRHHSHHSAREDDFGHDSRHGDHRRHRHSSQGDHSSRDYDRGRSRSPRRRHSASGHRSRSSHRHRSYDRSPEPPPHHLERRYESEHDRRRSPPFRRGDDRRFDGFRSRRFIPDHGPFRGRARIAPPHRSRSRSRSRYPGDVIDKAKLLEIARRNATLLMKKGVLPTDIFSKDQIVAIKAGGKSVEELTAYCRRLARKDAQQRAGGEVSDADDGSDGNGEADHFIHHPFMVKERPMPQITLNIRNAIPLPVRTPQELAIENAVRKTQFPVSSGCQHRFKELEWKEVDGDEDKKKAAAAAAAASVTTVATIAPTVAVAPESTPDVKPVASVDPSPAVAALPAPAVTNPVEKDTGISVEPPGIPQVDIGSVITARLKAMRALKENPECEEAKKQLDTALVEMEQWAQAKALEPKFLTVSDLQSGPQAWAKRDQLKNAKQVASGMGMHLLQKMGWKPGEGLGKNKEGTTEPLALDVKTDKKGLMSQADLKVKGPQANISMLYDLSGKHPVSALMELCTKRRWGPPVFELCFEHGPPHQKSFVFKVTVNGVEYQPCIATNNKKLAKANAAAFCLQSLGLLKPAAAPAPGETLQTVPGPVPAPAPGLAQVAGMHLVPAQPLQTVPNNIS